VLNVANDVTDKSTKGRRNYRCSEKRRTNLYSRDDATTEDGTKWRFSA